MNVTEALRHLANPERARFNARLLPMVDESAVLGVSMGDMRTVAKNVENGRLDESLPDFLAGLPHASVEENIVHVLAVNGITPASGWRKAMELFLPYADNWMVTDAIDPRILRSRRSTPAEVEAVLSAGMDWLRQEHTYTVRAGILVLLNAVNRGHCAQPHVDVVSQVRHEDYYVHMAAGWYLATVFEKAPAAVRPRLETGAGMDPRVWHLTMRKIVESRKTNLADRDWAKARRRQAVTAARASREFE